MPFCTTCGEKLNEGDKYCLACGNPLAIPTSVASSGNNAELNQPVDKADGVSDETQRQKIVVTPSSAQPSYDPQGDTNGYISEALGILLGMVTKPVQTIKSLTARPRKEASFIVAAVLGIAVGLISMAGAKEIMRFVSSILGSFLGGVFNQ